MSQEDEVQGLINVAEGTDISDVPAILSILGLVTGGASSLPSGAAER